MALSLSTPIIGSRPSFDVGEVLKRMKAPDGKDQEFFDSILEWSEVAGIDPAVPVAQFLLETDNGQSVRWNRDLNASGMGIVSDGTDQPFKIESVDESARLFVQCLYALVNRKSHPDIPLSGDAKRWFDSVWIPKVTSRAMPSVTKLADLGLRYIENGDSRATWSWENGSGSMDAYGNKLISRLNSFYPSLPDTSNEPASPDPSGGGEEPVARDPYDLIREYVVEAWVEKTGPGYGYSAGNRNIVGLAQHETQGIMTGRQRQAFFSCPSGERCRDALVDYGIPRNEKKIYVFQNPFTSNRIPYASGGTATAITQLARKASARMGNPYGGVNAFFAAVENELNHGQQMTADQVEMNARLLAYIWAMNDYQPNDAIYPDSLGNEVKTSVNHSDLYTSTSCRIVESDRQKFEAMAAAFLADFYGNAPVTPAEPAKPTYAPAAVVQALVPYMTADPGGVPAIVLAEGSEWIFVNDRITVARETPRLQRASPGALHVGDVLKKGETFTAKFMVKASAGDWYYLTAMFTRVQVRHTARLSDTP